MYRLLHILLLALTISLSTYTFAADKAPWTHESELALVKVGGNTESESYNGKQKTTPRNSLCSLSLCVSNSTPA